MPNFVTRNGSTLAQVRISRGGRRVFSRGQTFKTVAEARAWAASTHAQAIAALAAGLDPSEAPGPGRAEAKAPCARESDLDARERRIGDAAELFRLLAGASSPVAGPGLYILLDWDRRVLYVG